MDYNSRKSAPHLRDRVLKKDDVVRSSSVVSEVVGQFDTQSIQKMLESKCSAKTVTVDASCTFPLPAEGNKESPIS